MNVKYYYEFKGHDNILNRVEILTDKTVVAQEITVSYTPFLLEYSEVKKLTPIQGSGATLNLISKTIFQFENLHTDNMQEYLVKFYRGGLLYWMGWLDPELYEENLALYPPYPVEFTAADFNVMERLKFTSKTEARYTDIASLFTQLKRCLDRLDLPFDKLYIGCTTTAEGITLAASESLLHKLYIQSANFYDEDNKPMSCKEVIESILQPFGLMMIQRDASVYIYDYNTVSQGGWMKVYSFDTMSYITDEAVSFLLGDMSDIGFMSSNAPYGFEEMINNVSITSSVYADNLEEKIELDDDELSEKIEIERPLKNTWFYKKSTQIESLNGGIFAVYIGDISSTYDKGQEIVACYAEYKPIVSDVFPLFRVRSNKYITKVEPVEEENRKIYPYVLNIGISSYSSTSPHPIMIEGEELDNSEVLKLHCNLYITNDKNEIIAYYRTFGDENGWVKVVNNTIEQGQFILWFGKVKSEGSILNDWIINSDKTSIKDRNPGALFETEYEKGVFINPDISGTLTFEITNKSLIYNPNSEKEVDSSKVSMLLFDKIEIKILDRKGNAPSTDDYEFRSYINKDVVTDLEELTLKCISANEDKMPACKASILKKIGNSYDLQLSYTRSSQTNILERLLLCTIHSNYTRNNKKFTVDIKTTDNPAMRYSTLKNRWPDDKFLTSGCRIDFNQAITNLTVYNFSEDTDKLSDIPYE